MLVPYHQLLVPQSIYAYPSDNAIHDTNRFESYSFFKLNAAIVVVSALLLGTALLLG
jgi:hypothetical protein